MATILKFNAPALKEMMNEFHRLYDVAQTSEKKAHNTRIKAGMLLKDMRTRVKAGECGDITWWKWFEDNSVRSRKDAEKLLSLVESDDPAEQEAAEEEARENNRNAVSRLRKREKEFPVERITKLIGKLTAEQRQELGAAVSEVKLATAAAPVGDMPEQTARDRKALYAIESAKPAPECRPAPRDQDAAREKPNGPMITVPACANTLLRADQAVTEAAETVSGCLSRLSSEDIDYLVEKALTLANNARAFADLVRKSRADKRSHIVAVEVDRHEEMTLAFVSETTNGDARNSVIEPEPQVAVEPAPETAKEARERKKADHKRKHAEMLEALANGTAGDACIMRELAREQEARERAKALEPTAEAALDLAIPVFLRRERPEVA